MKNIKLILIGIAIFFVAITFVTANILYKNNQKLKKENERLENNNYALFSDNNANYVLWLKEKELTNKLTKDRDSIAKALKVKPKQIEKIVYISTTEKDTVVKEVPVQVIGKNQWSVSDTGKCFIWSGNVTLSDTILNVKRTSFSYQNDLTDVYYKKRPHKFLFIKYGKWKYEVSLTSKCGEPVRKEINFLK